MDNSTEARHEYILDLAEKEFGNEINVTRLKRSREIRANKKIWDI